MGALTGVIVPIILLRQHLPAAEHVADAPLDPREVLIWRLMRSLQDDHAACNAEQSSKTNIRGRIRCR